jgi:molecular chaperone DnaK (HSP70)
MSLEEKREEAEAVLDSAEMTLETFGGTGKTANELRTAVTKLENKLQEADSERELENLIEEVRELMEKVEEDSADMMMDDPGMEAPGGPGGGMPDDDMPPI